MNNKKYIDLQEKINAGSSLDIAGYAMQQFEKQHKDLQKKQEEYEKLLENFRESIYNSLGISKEYFENNKYGEKGNLKTIDLSE